MILTLDYTTKGGIKLSTNDDALMLHLIKISCVHQLAVSYLLLIHIYGLVHRRILDVLEAIEYMQKFIQKGLTENV